MASEQVEYNGFSTGDMAVRKGRLCLITKIHWETNPPSVTVKMQDNQTEVGTEFDRLERPSDEDMLKMPMDQKEEKKENKKPSTSNNSKNRKRSYFDAFFQERKQKFKQQSKSSNNSNHNNKNIKNTLNKNGCNDIPEIIDNSTYKHGDNRTFEDLLIDGPPKKRSKLCEIAQGWYCSACTVENPNMDALKCYLCETPRTFEEKIRYPQISPVVLPNDDNNNNKNKKKEQNDNNNNNDNNEDDDYVIVNNDNKENKEDNNNNNNNDNDKKMIKYITWNVWFNEELQLIERMKAIGDIIESQKADIVCLQEVTPLILDILQNGAWYKNGGYSSTILPSFGYFAGLRYFNVIMTKHEFMRDSIQFKQFQNSSMGRHLIITPIKLKGNNKIIYAATSHLESPVGLNQGGKKDKFSSERKQQIKYSLQLLDNKQFVENNNVIFGGDMNWCKPTKNYENDGDLNKLLNANWIDCYNKLYPNSKGYTYDAKTNGMLGGWLQNRLDRIVYKNNGILTLKDCQIIGREAIPNLNFVKTFKRKNGNEQKILPVLPSDHYGLCATFELV